MNRIDSHLAAPLSLLIASLALLHARCPHNDARARLMLTRAADSDALDAQARATCRRLADDLGA